MKYSIFGESHGPAIGVVLEGVPSGVELDMDAIQKEIARAGKTVIPPSDVTNALLSAHGSTPIISGATLAELVRRPELSYEILAPLDPHRPSLPKNVFFTVEVEIKYEGYLRRHLLLKIQQEQNLLQSHLDKQQRLYC